MELNDLDKSVLEKEYFALHSELQRFDNKSLTIKAWSVTLAGAIAGADVFISYHGILLLAALVSLMFWFIDASWCELQKNIYN